MDLLALHSLMKDKGFHYFEGLTNDSENFIQISFSTLHLGKGDSVNLEIYFESNTCFININTNYLSLTSHLTDLNEIFNYLDRNLH